ncbi:restriction endonuclease [Bradyrhizobium betae]
MSDEATHFPKDDADYKKLEKLVAKIQQDLAPQSKVSHNVRLKGKSGAQRQIDVLVEDRIGQYDIRIVLDCKDYKTPVDIKDVEECAGLFEDVSAQRGVIVCPAGFTKNAKARAQQLQIDLYSPIDTDPHKWQARIKIPAICDFRQARMSFGWEMSAPAPFALREDFLSRRRYPTPRPAKSWVPRSPLHLLNGTPGVTRPRRATMIVSRSSIAPCRWTTATGASSR